MKKFLKKVSLVFFVILLCFQNLCHADLVAPEPSPKEGLIALGIFIVPAIVGLLLTITIAERKYCFLRIFPKKRLNNILSGHI